MAVSAISLSLTFPKSRLRTLSLPSHFLPATLPPLPPNRRLLLGLNPRAAPILRTQRLWRGPTRALDDVDEAVLDPRPAADLGKSLLWAVLWASVSLVAFAFAGGGGDARAAAAAAADTSIKASGFGVRIAGALRGSGWPDGAVVFALATLPVIELRGAIPVGYWMQLDPVVLTVLSVIGNMVPVPFIVLYLKKVASFLAGKNQAASQFLDLLFQRAKEKAGPVEEFQWLGLMLFVAVPFPGTGAWTGAIVASVLNMPFWPAVSANFFGVVLAGLLVNLLVNLGLKYAIVIGIILFLVSTFMWSILRNIRKSLTSSS